MLRTCTLAISLIGTGCFAALLTIPYPVWEPDIGSAVENMDSYDNVLLIAGVAIAGVLGIHLVNGSQNTSETQPDEQHSEKLLCAADMLDSPWSAARSAGIFALRELAIGSSGTNYIPILDILCLFIREKLALPPKDTEKENCPVRNLRHLQQCNR